MRQTSVGNDAFPISGIIMIKVCVHCLIRDWSFPFQVVETGISFGGLEVSRVPGTEGLLFSRV